MYQIWTKKRHFKNTLHHPRANSLAYCKLIRPTIYMDEIFIAAILGVIQGITEFLPISSTGHLIVSASLLNVQNSPHIPPFLVFIQFGSILAVIVFYWKRFLSFFIIVHEKKPHFSGLHGIFLLCLTSLPAALLGFLAHDLITRYLFNPISVAVALGLGGIAILLAEKYKPRPSLANLDDLSWNTALGIGFFQCLALWPGFSRSASTIIGGLLLGAKRELAAEYSFIAAVPIMTGATAYAMSKAAPHLTEANLLFFAVGLLISFGAALLAIYFLIRLISYSSFKPFAWYRIIIAPIIYFYWS